MSTRAAVSARTLLCLLGVLSCTALVPVLLSPEIPPLDLPNHLGRAYILAALQGWQGWRGSPGQAGLGALYDVAWAPTPNLAADLLLTPLVALLGPRPAVRLFVGLSILGMAAGFALVRRVAEGRWEAGALLGLPLAHNLSLNYGFINYYWGVSAALCSFAAWLHLRRTRPLPRQLLFMIPLGLGTYLMHLVGFGALLVAIGASLLVSLWQARTAGRAHLLREALRGAAAVLSIAALPAALYLCFSSGAVGGQELHRVITWTGPRDKVLGVLRVLRAARPSGDGPLLGLVALLCGLGLRRLLAVALAGHGPDERTSRPAGQVDPPGRSPRAQVLGAGGLLLLLCLAMPGAFDLETADVDLRVALPALLLLVAALAELPASRPALLAALAALCLFSLHRSAAAAREWRRASAGIAQSRALCPLLPAGARVLTLHNEVPPPGEVEHGAGERHGWAYCLFDGAGGAGRPLFFPALFHVSGSQPLRLRLPAYEGTDTLAHYHVKNGFSSPQLAAEIPWPALLRLSDYLWLTGWDLPAADPRGLVPRACVEEVGRQPRIVLYRVRREVPGCILAGT